ncbi:SPFH/Band 7/PHB domain protein [Planctomycetota bacterium]|nr:SPFH/Band 7/PHB domain protein [Planctomycetota bacterium]
MPLSQEGNDSLETAMTSGIDKAIQFIKDDPAIIGWVVAAFVIASILKSKEARRLTFWSLIALGVLPDGASLLVVSAILVAFGIKFGLKRVPEGRSGIVLRLGKYSRTLRPGLNFILPGIEQVHMPHGLVTFYGDRTEALYDDDGFISLKEHLLDPAKISMIGGDNSKVDVDTIVYFTIVDPRKAAFSVDTLGRALVTLAETVLRQEVGRLDADELIKSRDVIGVKLQESLSIASEPWGTRINRVEIESIDFDSSLQDALSRAREEELKGRAVVVEAQRERDAEIARAEGAKRAQELAAEANFTQEKLRAEAEFLRESRRREGEAAGLLAIAESLKAAPEAMVALEALKAQTQVAEGLGKSKGLLLVPNETAGLVGALGSAVKALDKFQSRAKD